MKLCSVAIFLSFAAPTFGDDYRMDSCHGETFSTAVGLRQYSTWASTPYDNINYKPIDYNCNRTSAIIDGQYFSRPTRCVNYGPGPDVRAEFDVIDKSCRVDHSWLFEKIGKVIGKDFRCTPRQNSDGCTTVGTYQPGDKIGKDDLNAVCVVHDICYSIPASFGITQDKCDDLARDLAQYRCEEVNHPECFAASNEWFRYRVYDWLFSPIPDFSNNAYVNAQREKIPCAVTDKQRKSSLYQGSKMNIGTKRWSPKGRYLLKLESDGNLVIYHKPLNEVIWTSKTQGRGVVKAVMQYDGNFVLYTENNVAIWHTGTDGKPTNHLLLQDDGNLVIYSMGSPTAQWQTALHGGYLIPMSTNLRGESLVSTSTEDIDSMTVQEDLSDNPDDIVHFDSDPASAGSAPGQATKRALNGVN
jgi:hypothetical protein